MVLYDNPVSSNALKVRFLLAELGLSYEKRDVPLERPRPDWYLALNPIAAIPSLDDDGFFLTESNTILRYLAGREGREDLYPVEPRGRARVDEFLDRWSTGLRNAFYRVERNVLGFGGVPVDLDRARAEAEAIRSTLATVDGLIAGDTVLGSLSIADFAIAPVLFRAGTMPIDLEPFPRITRLREALIGRPSFTAAGPVA
jgi:glutathione S-transferase